MASSPHPDGAAWLTGAANARPRSPAPPVTDHQRFDHYGIWQHARRVIRRGVDVSLAVRVLVATAACVAPGSELHLAHPELTTGSAQWDELEYRAGVLTELVELLAEVPHIQRAVA